jgi:hypothetical protein
LLVCVPLRTLYLICRYPEEELPTYPTPLVKAAMQVWAESKRKDL